MKQRLTRVCPIKEGKGCWRLYTQTMGMPGLRPAGHRLRKGARAGCGWPLKSFTYDTRKKAQKAAEDLEQYIECDRRKRRK